MKAVLLLGGVLVAGLVISAALYSRRASVPMTDPAVAPAASVPSEVAPENANTATFTEPPAVNSTNQPGPKADLPSSSEPVPRSHEAYVDKRISELQDLSAENDAASLEVILSELTNRDRQIRKAAIQAAIQFGSRDAIPRLIEAAGQTDDPAEKTEFQEAADYLKLPSLTEVLAQQKNQPRPQIPAQPPRHNVPAKKQPPVAAPQ